MSCEKEGWVGIRERGGNKLKNVKIILGIILTGILKYLKCIAEIGRLIKPTTYSLRRKVGGLSAKFNTHMVSAVQREN